MKDSILPSKFSITPFIVSTLEEIERLRWLVDNTLLLPRHESRLRWMWRDVRVRRAVGTTRIEGANLDEKAVTGLIKRGIPARPTEDEQANINALAAYEFIDYLSDQSDIPIDELAIRELNRQLMRGSAETLTPGVYRKGQNSVGNFAPPDQGNVPSLMRTFALWLRQDASEIHPILKAGIAHIHLVAIHPFWDGNGRTARGLTTLLLQRSPFGFRKLLSLESRLYDIRDDYFSAIERTLGVRYSSEYDSTKWLEFFVLALRNDAQALVTRLTDWHRGMQDVYNKQEEMGLTSRQANGYAFALQSGQVTRSDYMDVTGVSQATASRDLARLVELGLLNPEGETRSRIYFPAKQRPVSEPEGNQLTLLEE